MVNRISRRARRGIAAVVLALAMVSAAAPAYALDGPVASEDNFVGTSRGVVSGDVLANDTWDPGHTARVTDAYTTSRYLSQVRNDQYGYNEPATASIDADGRTVHVDFGAWALDAPSGVRSARLVYTLTDSAGQSATGVAYFTEANDPTVMSVADDDHASMGWDLDPVIDLTRADSAQFNPLFNDTLGRWSDYTFEIVDAPTYGVLDGSGPWTYRVPGADAFEARADTFTYRAILNADPSKVSNVATVTVVTKRDAAAAPTVNHSFAAMRAFYQFGPTQVTLDLPAMYAARIPEADQLAAPRFVQRPFEDVRFGEVTDHGDGRFTYQLASTPTHDESGWLQHDTLYFGVLDETDKQVGVATIPLQYFAPGSTMNKPALTPAPAADEVWVKVGQSVPVLPFENDAYNVGAHGINAWEWVGPVDNDTEVYSQATVPFVNVVQQGSLGEAGFGPDVHGFSGYQAGDTAGTDTVVYELCAPYPVNIPEACGQATMTVHVSPEAVATDDERDGERGETVEVPVLDNDTYTDTPDRGAEVVVLTDVPEGVSARVTGTRAVAVSVPADYSGDTVDLGYRLTDFTGSSQARVLVRLASMQAPEVPVEESPVPPADEPVPTPDAPEDTPEEEPVADPVPTPDTPEEPKEPKATDPDTPEEPKATDPKEPDFVINAGATRLAATDTIGPLPPLVAMAAGSGLMVALIVALGLWVARSRSTQ